MIFLVVVCLILYLGYYFYFYFIGFEIKKNNWNFDFLIFFLVCEYNNSVDLIGMCERLNCFLEVIGGFIKYVFYKY